MFYCNSFNKRIIFIIIFFFIIFNFSYININCVCFSIDDNVEENINDNIENILDELEFSELDDYSFEVTNNENDFVTIVKNILYNDSLFDYNSLYNNVNSILFNKIKDNLRFYIEIFIIVVLYEIFISFLPDKFLEFKKSIKFVFLLLISSYIVFNIKSFYCSIDIFFEKLFHISKTIFPILISLLNLSGATKSSSIFSSLSVFLLNSGTYLIGYVLLPICFSILLLSVFSSVFNNNAFSNLIKFLMLIFKYIIIAFVSVFGILSTINVVASSSVDGINLRLTKYAIKNYVPILGGYVSDGFDYLHSCSVLVKNAVGVSSIFVFLFISLNHIFSVVVFSIGFKMLSLISSFVGTGDFSKMFDNVSKAFSIFLTIIVGFLIIIFIFIFLTIISVGVV